MRQFAGFISYQSRNRNQSERKTNPRVNPRVRSFCYFGGRQHWPPQRFVNPAQKPWAAAMSSWALAHLVCSGLLWSSYHALSSPPLAALAMQLYARRVRRAEWPGRRWPGGVVCLRARVRTPARNGANSLPGARVDVFARKAALQRTHVGQRSGGTWRGSC